MAEAEMRKRVYSFEEGNAGMRAVLGGKGANLAEMTRIGLPVPPGFTISAQTCIEYYSEGRRFPAGLKAEISEAMKKLEAKVGRTFGAGEPPLLVSVRSGAAVSMPGMMDTILNLGLNDDSVDGLARATGDPRFAYDCYRRFIQMFGNVVLKIEHDEFERALDRIKVRAGAKSDRDLTEADLRQAVREFKEIILRKAGVHFPQDPGTQLEMAVGAVFESWNNPRAQVYRRVNRIPDDMGTAVNVQMMVFGNMGDDSATGVLFTRNPSTGEKELYGEYLPCAQGEDVVAGIRTPRPIAEMARDLPGAYSEIKRYAELLEAHYRDMQDIEFTVERGRLFILQTRNAKRSPRASIRIAVDLVREGKIREEDALRMVEPEHLSTLLHSGIDPDAPVTPIAFGLPASPGAAIGKAIFSADLAEELGQKGEKVILVRPETTPDDMHGIVPAQGVLTSRGGMTCHAAIVARGMGKPCVVGCEALQVDLDNRRAVVKGAKAGPESEGGRAGAAWGKNAEPLEPSAADIVINEGDIIAIDGATGRVFLGEVPLVEPTLGAEFQALLEWADRARSLGVRANADTPEDARKAREFGAEGIGLCRTEHMFMAQDRLPVVQEMIMASTERERREALDKLLVMQTADFEGILEAMQGFPVTIRLLDPPLHEFLPDVEELSKDIEEARGRGDSAAVARLEEVLKKARALAEANPMLGFRGCRLGVVYPEIYEMQVRAIFTAACSLVKRGIDARPEVMIPLVSHANELELLRKKTVEVAEAVMAQAGVKVPYTVGTMIEVPRAALTADEVAKHAEFFSFGTNDLTQTTFGFSRDDAEAKFLHHYVREKILPDNPFAVLDRGGVGKLMEMAVALGRRTRPGLKVGICGEHGGDPSSVEFCHMIGLDYVSCSPYRVPIARLAAAQAAIKHGSRRKEQAAVAGGGC